MSLAINRTDEIRSDSIEVSTKECNHSGCNHLFCNWSCKEVGCLSRVGIAVFHFFTLGIPLCVATLANGYTLEEENAENSRRVVVDSKIQPRVQSLMQKDVKDEVACIEKIRKEALQYAEEELSRREPSPQIYEKCISPDDEIISKMAALRGEFNVFFIKALRKYQESDSWKEEEVLKAADALMKISFSLSMLTLEDLPNIGRKLIKKNIHRSRAGIVSSNDVYASKTFLSCAWAYQHIRSGIVWRSEKIFTPERPSQDHSSSFYLNSRQAQWRKLYNSFCDQIDLKVGKHSLNILMGDKILPFITKDTDQKVFETVRKLRDL